MANLEVREFQTAKGKIPLTEWLENCGMARRVPASWPDWIGLRRAYSATGRLSAAAFVNCVSITDLGTACTTGGMVRRSSCCYAAATRAHKRRISRQPMRTGKTTKPAFPSRPFRAAEHLRSEAEVAAYIEAMLQDGDARAVPIALRTVVDSVGGMAALADKTGLSRETLYRTLSDRGNPRLDTLAVILAAFGLRLTVQPAQKSRARRSEPRAVLA